MEKVETGDILTLVDENDQEQEIEVLGTLKMDGTEYMAVAFTDELEEDTDEEVNVFFLKGEDPEQLSIIDDDDEFEKVSTAFQNAEEQGE
ncbi:DUF1292 domain-containing protein [Domibacillus indicus]|uniref:DUF1292 domain-containing protein n=1 Tax=Domibacillus indicus TaxID=1437523 RepID=UPI000617AA54|nr:DUF1292 domain-containing protein [Domibacillus indicus]